MTGVSLPSTFRQKMAAPPLNAADELSPDQINRLRELRAELLDLRKFIEKVKTGSISLEVFKDYVRKSKDDVDSLMQAMGSDASLRKISRCDVIRNIQDDWELISLSPILASPDAAHKPEEQLQYISIIDEYIKNMVYLIGFLTIPSRVNEWLSRAEPGYYIPFHLAFGDELPSREDRVKLLEFLAWSPKALDCGIVDAAGGIIYRYSKDATTRALSVISLAGLILATIAVIVIMCYLPSIAGIDGWPLGPEDLYTLLISWTAVLAGIFIHIGIGSVKRGQRQGIPSAVSVTDITRIINAMQLSLIVKLLLALAAFFSIVFASGVTRSLPLNAFLVGYSLDSFLELFGMGLEQRAAAQISAFEKGLSTGEEK